MSCVFTIHNISSIDEGHSLVFQWERNSAIEKMTLYRLTFWAGRWVISEMRSLGQIMPEKTGRCDECWSWKPWQHLRHWQRTTDNFGFPAWKLLSYPWPSWSLTLSSIALPPNVYKYARKHACPSGCLPGGSLWVSMLSYQLLSRLAMHVLTGQGCRVFYLIDTISAEQFFIWWYWSHLEFLSSQNNTTMKTIVKSFCMSLMIKEVEQMVKDTCIFTDFEDTGEAILQMSTLSYIPSCEGWRSISFKLFPSLVNSFLP